MRFSVYLKEQAVSDSPSHKASRTLGEQIIDARLGRKIGQHAIQLTTSEDWATVKAKFRVAKGKKKLPILLPECGHYLPYNFPLSHSFLAMYERGA